VKNENLIKKISEKFSIAQAQVARLRKENDVKTQEVYELGRFAQSVLYSTGLKNLKFPYTSTLAEIVSQTINRKQL
jgi:hypothetical protein